ncbi:hypothetical protein Cycma_1420 [Cyclobacterium marinum DSM 745]|uniref:Uncharacterized protein n=1 Tax=Cyclobacterium marinum (strain ATCC 25205 / DSM 745 / LMG 13164 / NCIMB 1802) TaxID=880070 RepID=G0J2B5_CYCMS|nr:hypothetical protein Cycma_1420 [Cyclobacterium marinum DSM 745]|tara:strand:- start:20494 stop:20619 length:126 start_codon:yes stop_codon:yes gene_type:complete
MRHKKLLFVGNKNNLYKKKDNVGNVIDIQLKTLIFAKNFSL